MTSGRCSCGFSIAALRLPARNSIARYCQDWKPGRLAERVAELGVFAGRHRAQHVPGAGQLLEDARHPGQHLEGRLQPVLADRRHGRADLVDGELHPELGGLVLDDEQQLVMRVRQRLLRVEHAFEMQVVAIGHAPGERHLRAFARRIVRLAAHVTAAFALVLGRVPEPVRHDVFEDRRRAEDFRLADIERREAEADRCRARGNRRSRRGRSAPA